LAYLLLLLKSSLEKAKTFIPWVYLLLLMKSSLDNDKDDRHRTQWTLDRTRVFSFVYNKTKLYNDDLKKLVPK